MLPPGVRIPANQAKPIPRQPAASESQAVRLPKPVALPDTIVEVEIVAVGNTRTITPAGSSWDEWFDGPCLQLHGRRKFLRMGHDARSPREYGKAHCKFARSHYQVSLLDSPAGERATIVSGGSMWSVFCFVQEWYQNTMRVDLC